MKRGTVLGGAPVWATPIVQTMARPAFASEGTIQAPLHSFVAMVIRCDDILYGVKWGVKWGKDENDFESNPGPQNSPPPGISPT